MLYCSNPLIAYELGNGILTCTDEAAHSTAVLARIGDERPTMYAMRIRELDGEIHCAFNFRSPKLAGSSNLKLAGNLEEIKKNLPSLIAEYKLRRIVFDDRELYEHFQEPGVGRLLELISYLPGPAPTFGVERFEPKSPKPVVSQRSRQAAGIPAAPSPKKSASRTWIWLLVLALVLFLMVKAC